MTFSLHYFTSLSIIITWFHLSSWILHHSTPISIRDEKTDRWSGEDPGWPVPILPGPDAVDAEGVQERGLIQGGIPPVEW